VKNARVYAKARRYRKPEVQINMWVEVNSTLDLLYDEARRLRVPYSELVRSLIRKYLIGQLITPQEAVRESMKMVRASAESAPIRLITYSVDHLVG
jgi:hypothetical protein